jgi:hypothetical protein
VKAEDIEEGYIPISSLSQAIRLDFDPSDYQWFIPLIDRIFEKSSEKWSLRILENPNPKFSKTLLKSGKAPQ